MVSMKDVAEKAGVSVATISRVLADKPNVRPEVREHVLKVVKELGYRRNRIASNLRTQTSNVIGMVVPDIREGFFTDIARGIEDVAQQKQMSVFLCNTDEDPVKEEQYLNTLLDEYVAGIILSPTPNPNRNLQNILESNTPIVVVDRHLEGFTTDCVLSNNEQSAYMLTRHLIEQGSERVAALIGMGEITTGRERMDGYLNCMSEFGLESLSEFVYPGEEIAEAVVNGWLETDNPPDAIMTGNIRLTIGALTAIKRKGLSVPDDILLGGFDETVWMQHLGPGITVISQPTYEMGRSAAELLLQRIENPDRPAREMILKGELIIRDSTRQG